jgi:2-polyprenyl-3-methyl-5-hydroxy-6-metoxy-1,4-benzoquinol methylase
MKKNIIAEKMSMLRHNPRIMFYWGYKFLNFFRKNALNNGERYDPNILGMFAINDFHQEARYYLAQSYVSKADRVIDIACGTGYGTAILADSGLSAVGVDISKKSIRYANEHYKKNSKISFIQSDMFGFDGSAEVVVSFETIEHIEAPIEKTVEKLLSLSRNKIICSVPYKEPAGSNRYHVHSNIGESDFDFMKKDHEVVFLYQSEDGKIWPENNGNILTLIIIINKISV